MNTSTSLSPLHWANCCTHMMMLFIVLFGILSTTKATRNPSLSVTYEHNGITCLKCPPGTFLHQHCTESFTRSVCRPCPSGTYQTSYTQALACGRCDTQCLHDINMVVRRNCSSKQNLKCQCRDGYYLHYEDYTKSSTCKILIPCSEGLVTIRNGSLTSQYKCALCPEGQFYNSAKECQMCSSCEDSNTIQLSACNATADATCENVANNDISTTLVVAGIVGGCVVVVVFISVGVCCYLRRRQHSTELNQSRPSQAEDKEDTPTSLPLIPRASTNSKRTRTLSESSTTSTTSQYPELTNRETWMRQVFQALSIKLSDNWQTFMRNLPGNCDWRKHVHPMCVQISMEERCVREQIYKALMEWAQSQEDEHVKVESILHTLYIIEDCESVRKDIKQLCRKLNKDRLRRNSSVTSTC